MSQFQETFTKQGSREPLLDYDDNAFVFFANTILICIIIPWSYKIIKRIFFSDPLETFKPKENSKLKKNTHFCNCSLCKTNYQNKEFQTKKTQKFTKGLFFQIFILFLLITILILLIRILPTHQSIQTFNPFKILGIEEGSDIATIRRTFRQLSSKFHPDLNPNDPEIHAKFLLITKAYATLTVPELWENYLRYSNPDGPGTMKYKIGLPRFLIKKENELLILSVFFIMLLLILPTIFLVYYRKQQRYASNGVRVETLQFLYYVITDGTRIRKCPEILSLTSESNAMTLNETDNVDMSKVTSVLQDIKKGMWGPRITVRNYLLLMAHLQRFHSLLSPKLMIALDLILSKSILIIRSMIEIAIFRNWYLTAKSFIDFQRCLIQAVDFQQSSLLQIPHYDESVLKQSQKLKKGKTTLNNLSHYICHFEERKGLNFMNENQITDIQNFCEHISDIELEVNIRVEDEDIIVVGDIATCHVKLTRKNLKEGEYLGPIHAPFFPLIKSEEWWIFITDSKSMILAHTITNKLDRVIEEHLQFEITRSGKNTINIEVICDSYLGIDKTKTLEFIVNDLDRNRSLYVHPEDAKLDDEPTLFQQMMGNALLGASSDDENELENKEEVEYDEIDEENEKQLENNDCKNNNENEDENKILNVAENITKFDKFDDKKVNNEAEVLDNE